MSESDIPSRRDGPIKKKAMAFKLAAPIILILFSNFLEICWAVRQLTMWKTGKIVKNKPICIDVKPFFASLIARMGSIILKWVYANAGEKAANMNLGEQMMLQNVGAGVLLSMFSG